MFFPNQNTGLESDFTLLDHPKGTHRYIRICIPTITLRMLISENHYYFIMKIIATSRIHIQWQWSKIFGFCWKMQRICFVFYYNYNYCYHPVDFSVFQFLCFRCESRNCILTKEATNFPPIAQEKNNNTKNFQTKYNNTDVCTPNTEQQNIIYSFKVIQSLAYSYKDNII